MIGPYFQNRSHRHSSLDALGAIIENLCHSSRRFHQILKTKKQSWGIKSHLFFEPYYGFLNPPYIDTPVHSCMLLYTTLVVEMSIRNNAKWRPPGIVFSADEYWIRNKAFGNRNIRLSQANLDFVAMFSQRRNNIQRS